MSLRIRRPSWTKPFIEEPRDYDDEVQPKAKQGIPYVTICLLVLTIVGFILQILIRLSAPCVLLALAAVHLAVRRPRTASIFLLVIFTALLVYQVSIIASQWTPDYSKSALTIHGVNIGISIVAIVAVVNLPLRDPSLSRNNISRPFTPPDPELRSPEDNLTLWQWMTVTWMYPLISIGFKRQLHDADVWLLGYEFQHKNLHEAFRELQGTVVRRLLRANWIDLVILTVLAIVELVANYSVPVLLQQLLKAMENLHFTKRPAMTFALLILAVRLVAAQSAVFSLWFGRRCYERSRGEMITMLFEKTLNRKIISTIQNRAEDEDGHAGDSDANTSPRPSCDEDETENQALLNGHTKPDSERSFISKMVYRTRSAFAFLGRKKTPVTEDNAPASMGKILNLMRGDVYEVSQRFWEFQTLVNKPVGLILSLILTWNLLGWPCLVGIAVIVVTQILNAIFARILIKWEQVRRKATDRKLQQVSAYVEAIRHLRYYAWYQVWLDRILDARQTELNLKIITSIWNIAIRFVNILGSGLLPVAAFYAFTALAGEELRIDIAFPALQLFDMVQSNLKEIPGLITVLLNASVAVGRIESFMKEPNKTAEDSSVSRSEDALELKDATFAWPGLSKNVLHNLTMSFPPGLTVVFGPVAAGKSALLQALLGELDLRQGELIVPDAPIGYCAQTPWLQSMSIRENILFSAPYDDVRYKQTLDACALTADLANFKHGDLSNIGENGIGLSGGQKARVALARAIYSRAKILFLDDPLSALDQQTAESIVSKCFGGDLVKGRTVILVTHRTDLCKGLAEQLIEISHGTARAYKGDSLQLSPQSSNTDQKMQQAASTDEVDKAQEAAAVPDKFEEEEKREHGGVKAAVYWQYVKAGRLGWWAVVIFSAVVFRLFMILETWFLKEWGEAYGDAEEQLFTFQSPSSEIHILSSPVSRFFDRFPDPSVNVRPWLIGYLIINITEAVLFSVTQVLMLVITYIAGKAMFKDIMQRVSHTTFRYYDVVPIGRLMNRLTSDIGTIDGNISDQFLNVAWQGIAWVSSLAVIASVTPLFLVFSLILTTVFVVIFLRFLPTSQSLRRLEMVSLSPLMSNFGALLNGLTTVRAFCAQSRFQDRVIEVTDAFQKMDHFYWSLHAWLLYRFDVLSACSTFILTLLAIHSGLSPGLTAFVLMAASKFVQTTDSLCKQYGRLQLDFVSVERVVEFLHLEQEPPGEIDPPASWPSYDSDIVYEDVTVRYAPHLDPALSGVSFTLKGGSNTAVIGRTGSGKSTLALTLLATIAPESGRILIGGIDISRVNKQALRSRITFLAQDPILFPGSLRHNLDPTEEHSDDACETVLARVCGNYNWTLQTQIDVGGRNLSQGQRQLVGLARAVLRRSAIVIMDEATASIDKETAWEIQRVLREEMKESTVITIAHRPSAVRGANWCLALGNGRVVEQGTPDEVDIARSSGPDAI